jgi:hypothetical protein
MAAVTSVGIVNGVPTSGTGEVMTLDVIAAKLDTCITALQIIDNMVLSAGTAAIGKLATNSGVNIGEVSVLASQLGSLQSTAQAMVAGFQLVSLPTDLFVANDASAASQNPWTIGGYASAAAPTDVSADNDAVRAWFLRNGAQVVTVNGSMVAHDAADANNPVKIGGRAVAGMGGLTLVAAADRTDALFGIDGAQYVRPHCGLEDIVTGNATDTTGNSIPCIAAQAAGVKTYLTSIVLCNTSATAITVDIKDGSTVKVSLPLPAGSGCVFNPPVPIPGTAATAWNFDGSAAATTVTCSMVGFKSKV